jgi:hypothetical protein
MDPEEFERKKSETQQRMDAMGDLWKKNDNAIRTAKWGQRFGIFVVIWLSLLILIILTAGVAWYVDKLFGQ